MVEQEASVETVEEEAFSPRELATFALRATRRHLRLCMAVSLLVLLLGSAVVSALPPVFDATCKIFVQDGGAVTSSLASGRERYRPIEGARGLEEFILARDNLLSIVREAELFDSWPRTRALPMQVKDRVFAYLFGPPDRIYMERGFAEMLTAAVAAEKEGESIRIHAQWRDPQNAYDIARLVQRNFIAARAAHDLGPIRRAIPFLEGQLREADEELERAIARMQGSLASRAKDSKSDRTAGSSDAKDPDLVELAALSRELSENRRQQRSLVGPRRQRVQEMRLQLIDLKASYSADHPLVRQQEARIEAMTASPEALSELRKRESELQVALSTRGIIPKTEEPRKADDPEFTLQRARLGTALRKSDEMAARLEAARIELATAEADFEHRYVVVEEPEVPKKPLKAKKKLMMLIGVLIAALVMGVLVGVALELRKGRLIEPWQVRALGVEVLGEVDLRKLLPRNNP